MLKQPINPSIQEQQCSICNQSSNSLATLINHSLYDKYSSSQNFYYGKQVNEILQEAISSAYIRYQDNYYDDNEQYLKRKYREQQYKKKIQILSQYYKFHRDLPTWNQKYILGIMLKYYNRIKDIDYKKIKQVLKKQQGISLTTHNSFSSLEHSEYTKKSRYSTMLKDLDRSNDSLFLRQFCQQIDKAFRKIKIQNYFKGVYYSGEKKFQEYLKKQRKRKQNMIKRQQQNKKQVQKKQRYQKKYHTKNDDIIGLKQIIFGSNYSIKDDKYIGIKNTISNQKTIINQTISNQQKQRRQKNKSIHPTSSRQSITKKFYQKDPFLCDFGKDHYKFGKYYQVDQFAINNQNICNGRYEGKKNDENKQKKFKINGITTTNNQLTRKCSVKQLVHKIKYRSNSYHNLPTSAMVITKDLSKKDLLGNNIKINRSSSKKSISISVAKRSVIDTDTLKLGQDEVLSYRQGSQKLIRKNSSSKLKITNPSQKKSRQLKSTLESGKIFTKKRSSAVQNILQKKLEIYRKKTSTHVS